MDFIHVFVKDQREFRTEFLSGQKHLKPDGMLWVSWLKKSSKVPTNLDENVIRNFGLHQVFLAIKVCAVDEVWSALKFVVRVKDRKFNMLKDFFLVTDPRQSWINNRLQLVFKV